MQIAMIAQRGSWRIALALSALMWSAACGGSKGDDDEDAGSQAEKCPQAGITQTGCVCSSEQPSGSRNCQKDLTWSACKCPGKTGPTDCQFEGQDVLCNPCPGETKGRMTKCLQGGTFDCTCPMR
jgi:hypothetical protein